MLAHPIPKSRSVKPEPASTAPVQPTFVVRTFILYRGHLAIGQDRQFLDLQEAVKMARRLGQTAKGVVVFKLSGDPDADATADPEVVWKAGRLPPELHDAG